jgi:hypothetical protein
MKLESEAGGKGAAIVFDVLSFGDFSSRGLVPAKTGN